MRVETFSLRCSSGVMIGFLGGAILAPSFLPDIAVLNSIKFCPGHRSYLRQEITNIQSLILSIMCPCPICSPRREVDALRGLHARVT